MNQEIDKFNKKYNENINMNEQRNKLVTENMGLVVSTARKYQGRGLELDDLVSEGTIGMIKAAEKYDPEKAKRK